MDEGQNFGAQRIEVRRGYLAAFGLQIFDLSAHLEAGDDLHPLILKGEVDERAMEALAKVLAKVEAKVNELPADKLADVRGVLDEAIDKIKNNQHGEAIRLAEKVDQLIQTGAGEADPLRRDANWFIYLAELALHRYNWAIEATKTYDVNQLIEETRSALISGDPSALKAANEKLLNALNSLPKLVIHLVNLGLDINGVVNAHDPGLAVKYEEELRRVEEAFKEHRTDAADLLAQLSDKVANIKNVVPDKEKCSRCSQTFATDDLVCGKCGMPRGLLSDDASRKTSDYITK